MVHMTDRGLQAWGNGTHIKYVMKCVSARSCEQMIEHAEMEVRLRSETKMEERLLGLVMLGHLFLHCSRVEILQEPPPAPSASELPGIPCCSISTKAFPYSSSCHWLYLFKSNLTDDLLNFIFSNWTRNIVFKCRKYGEAVYIMFFNSAGERDLAGD